LELEHFITDKRVFRFIFKILKGVILPKRDFEKLLLEAVDEGLFLLGESSKQAIYYHLEKGFNLKRHELPYKIEEFADAIEKIFGLGANFFEILIMKRLYIKDGRTLKWQGSKDFTFTEYVAAVRRSFLEKKRAEEAAPCEQMLTES